jgi:hypothetical protein
MTAPGAHSCATVGATRRDRGVTAGGQQSPELASRGPLAPRRNGVVHPRWLIIFGEATADRRGLRLKSESRPRRFDAAF